MAQLKRARRLDERSLDRMLRALGDPTRRRILELVKKSPGMKLQDLVEEFPISRFALMKHLNVLEAAWLIRREREGVSKKLYVHVAPLEDVSAWLDRFLEK